MTLMKFEEAALEEATELLKVEGQTVSINKRLLALLIEIAKSNKVVYLPSPIPASPGIPEPIVTPVWKGPYFHPIDPFKPKDIYEDFETRGKTTD